MKSQLKYKYITFISLLIITTFASSDALAIKYMSLKDAIKHYLPKNTKLFKKSKTVPSDKMADLTKKFKLKSTIDFKETLSKGPYTFYIARDKQEKALVYILILEQYWRTCFHKYAISISPSGKINEIVVVELNCHYAYPINRKSFLGQFKNKKISDAKNSVLIGKDIDAISGATASSDATAIVTRRALALFDIFYGS